MSEEKQANGGLPENAHRVLNEGEVYKPLVSAGDRRPEVTSWSIAFGVMMAMIFTATAVYIALRSGNGIEVSIPIALLAIIFGKTRQIRSSILENVMVQSVGQAAGVVAAGATFVIPALYINQLDVSWWQIFLSCAVGGAMGIVLIIPLRRQLVAKEHGLYPFPEGKAIAGVVVAGERTGSEIVKILLLSFFMGAFFDFMADAVHLWNSDISTSLIPWGIGERLDGLRIEVQAAGLAALFGMGLLIGPQYAKIIVAGSVLAWVVLVPIVYLFGSQTDSFSYLGKSFDIASMGSGRIFASFIKPLGIGAIAVAGIISIIRMRKTVVGAMKLGVKGFFRKGAVEPEPERTDLDIAPRNVFLIQMLTVLAMGVVFFVVAMTTTDVNAEGVTTSYGVSQSLLFAVVGMVVGYILSFLFTSVAAQAIAIMGVNPVSGMTLIAVVLAVSMLILVGLTGKAGMIVALIVGATVCTALSTSGAFISDLKVGYWIGSTPRNQQRWKFLGVAVAALVAAFVIPIMDQAYQFVIPDPANPEMMIPNDSVLPAPQANMIAAVVKGLMDDPANQPWLVYGLGGVMAIILTMAGVPALAFALGMFLPIGVNMAVLAGAFCAYLIKRSGKTEKVRKARSEYVDLIAAGLMAGAALFGIGTAALRIPALDAPIRYISVGVDYRLEAVVNGKVMQDEDGIVIESCKDVMLQEGQSCNEKLTELPFQLDEKGVPILDEGGKPKLAHPWYNDIGSGIGFLMLILLGFGCYGIAKLGAKWKGEKEEVPD